MLSRFVTTPLLVVVLAKLADAVRTQHDEFHDCCVQKLGFGHPCVQYCRFDRFTDFIHSQYHRRDPNCGVSAMGPYLLCAGSMYDHRDECRRNDNVRYVFEKHIYEILVHRVMKKRRERELQRQRDAIRHQS